MGIGHRRAPTATQWDPSGVLPLARNLRLRWPYAVTNEDSLGEP